MKILNEARNDAQAEAVRFPERLRKLFQSHADLLIEKRAASLLLALRNMFRLALARTECHFKILSATMFRLCISRPVNYTQREIENLSRWPRVRRVSGLRLRDIHDVPRTRRFSFSVSDKGDTITSTNEGGKSQNLVLFLRCLLISRMPFREWYD